MATKFTAVKCLCERRPSRQCRFKIDARGLRWTCTRPAFHEGHHLAGWPHGWSPCSECPSSGGLRWPNEADVHYEVLRELLERRR